MLLNVHTVYSLLESTVDIQRLIQVAKERGYTSVGIADVNVLHGVYEFYKQARKAGIKPLIGMTIEMSGIVWKEQTSTFLIYARSYSGYQTLIQLSRILNQTPVKQTNVWQLIQANHSELIIILSGKNNELFKAVFQDDVPLANRTLQVYQQYIPATSLYIGLHIYPLNELKQAKITSFANQHAIKTVISQPVDTVDTNEAFSLRVLEAIKNNENDLDRSQIQTKGTNYIYEQAQLIEMYQKTGLEETVKNTANLIEQLNVKLPDKQYLLPRYDIPDDYDADSYLRFLTHESLTSLQLHTEEAYVNQLNHELEIIQEMGFSDYFLIVWDIIKYCREKGIRIGPGRGSAAGSLVSYLLHITSVDPLQYNLLFERFLNPKRVSMPDIDIDIPDNKREQVFRYIEKRYGHDQVAHIITFGTFGAKQAIRDTLRVLGANSEELKQWSKAIPKDQNQVMTLQRAFKESKSLRTIVESNPFNQEIFKVALTLEGLPRHTSTHAAAVVINDFPLEDVIPVMERPQQLMVTQFTMYDVEQIGLLKMDFLGLRNLTILDDILKAIEQNQEQSIDIENIDMNDGSTLELFQKGDMNGVFQFESEGIKSVLKRLHPESFEDIVAVNALYRPGPIKQIDSFINRKHGKETIDYVVPELKSILSNTYGIIVYQEQVIQILVRMGQFDLGEADVLRRAMSKKQSDIMEEERTHFIQGATEQGFQVSDAERVYNYIYEFSNYGFNRAHAVVYSTLAFQLAYLKAHYPLEFYLAILNNGSSSTTTHVSYIQEAKKRLKHILSVDINRSLLDYSIDKQALRLGFNSIKGMRKEFAEHIIDERHLTGNYTDLLDFLRRLPQKFLKAEMIKPLIEVGAFDTFGYNRATLSYNLDKLIQSVIFSGQNMTLFQEMEPRIEWVNEWSQLEIIEKEREILGFSLSGHPIDAFEHLYKHIPHLIQLEEVENKAVKTKVQTIGFINDKRIIQTKKGEPMAFVTISNEVYETSLVVFPNVYQRMQQILNANTVLLIYGTVEKDRQGRKQIIATQLKPAQDIETTGKSEINTCFIQVPIFKEAVVQVEQLKQIAIENPGPAKIILVDRNRKSFQLDEPYLISYSQRVQQELRKIFGQSAVVFK